MPGAVKKKGGKRSRRGKKGTDTGATKFIPKAEENQEYCRVVSLLGDARLSVVNSSGVERIAIIRGKFRKRVWINKNDIIVIALRGYQDDRVDVVHKYQAAEVKQLVRQGEIPRSLLSDDDDAKDDGDTAGIAWAMPDLDEDEEADHAELSDDASEEGSENGENGENGDNRVGVSTLKPRRGYGKKGMQKPKPVAKPIAPQPVRPNLSDISSDSSSYDLEDL